MTQNVEDIQIFQLSEANNMTKYTRDTHIYVTEEDWTFINKLAEKEDLSVTQLIRRLIKKERSFQEAEGFDSRKVKDSCKEVTKSTEDVRI